MTVPRYWTPCDCAPGGILEVEVTGPGLRPDSVRLRSIDPAATYEIPAAVLAENYAPGRRLRLEKVFGREFHSW